ncbi:MAG TPA: SOS response-associated peptidase family protein, partial [Tepidiformaceae bacterium]
GEWQSTFSIVTTGANGVIGRIHDRMPVILSEEAAGAWIFEGEKEPARLLSLLVPAPEALLVPRAVLPGVNSANAEGAGLLDEAPGVQLSLV